MAYGAARKMAQYFRKKYNLKTSANEVMAKSRRNIFAPGVTNQYDVKTIYRKRRMPRRKRRQWVKAVKKHRAIALKSVGTRTAIKNGTIGGAFQGDAQYIVSAALYGLYGINDWGVNQGYRDMYDILNGDTTGDVDAMNEKCLFTSGVMDLTFNNIGDTKLEVDIYHIRVGDSTVSERLDATYGTALANTDNNSSTPVTTQTRGWTPFEATVASSRGVRVYKKIKHFVGVGEVFTHQIRDSKNHMMNGSKLWNNSVIDQGLYNWVGKSQYLFFIVKAVPGTDAEAQSNFRVGVTRVYKWKVFEDNQDFIGQY